MDIVVMSEKGQVTIPRDVRKRLNIRKGTPLLVVTDDLGGIRMSPAAVLPVEIYSKSRLAEFAKEDALTPAESAKLRKVLKR